MNKPNQRVGSASNVRVGADFERVANVPSAKMTVWNEAMYYFHLAPQQFRKILFVLHDRRNKDGESLLSYYKRTYFHMIPEGVEFLEWDEVTGDSIKA